MVLQRCLNLKSDLAYSGEDAIMKCKNRAQRNLASYKLIIMDINMPPGMNGVEATQKIKK